MTPHPQPSLQSTISSIPGITPEQIGMIISRFHPQRHPKNHHLLREGEICRFTAYVVKGCVSNYRILQNGKKAINHFAFEDWWVGDLDSFLNKRHSKTYCQTLEETDLLSISKSDFDHLLDNVPPFERFVHQKTRSAFLKEMENADKDKSETAIERYLRMVNDYPQIQQRVPSYDIAAYLGIAPESLSRIRSQALKQTK